MPKSAFIERWKKEFPLLETESFPQYAERVLRHFEEHGGNRVAALELISYAYGLDPEHALMLAHGSLLLKEGCLTTSQRVDRFMDRVHQASRAAQAT